MDLENNSNEKPNFMQGGGFIFLIIFAVTAILLGVKYLID